MRGGGRIQIPLLAGHQRPTSETPFKWRFAGGPMLAQHWMLAKLESFVVLQGIRTNIAKKPYIFVIGSGPPVSPSGSAHVYVFIHLH